MSPVEKVARRPRGKRPRGPEQKHDVLLQQLEKFKTRLYPYA
jgi:hypothetical protein